MSSGISIEKGRLKPTPAAETAIPGPIRVERSRRDNGFHAWHFFVLASIILATAAVILTRQSRPEHLILLSFTIAAAGGVAAAFYRMLLPLVSPSKPAADVPLTDRRRAMLERDKMLALRAIKELEFDRAMGKLSQKDFDEMAGRLRQRALTLMKQLDDGVQYRTIIEEDLRRRLEPGVRLKLDATSDPPAGGVRLQPDQLLQEDHAFRLECACGTMNDSDAVFCKTCGTRLKAI